MSDKLDKLRQLVDLANEGLTRQEFADAFKTLIDFIKKTDQALSLKVDTKTQTAENRLTELSQLYQETIKKIEAANTSSLSNIKKWALEEVGKLFINSKINERLSVVDSKLAEMNAFKFPDASTVIVEASEAVLKELIPKMPVLNWEEDLPKYGLPIRDALELLPDGEKLEIEAIQDLRKELDELKKATKNVTSGQAAYLVGSASGGRIVKSYDLSPYLDGVTTVFSLPAMWRIISIVASSFPNALRETIDWVHNAGTNTLIFTSEISAANTLASGQTVTLIFSE